MNLTLTVLIDFVLYAGLFFVGFLVAYLVSLYSC